MTFLPVVGRELLISARHAFTYYLRVLGAGAALVASLLFAMDNGFGANLGAQMFAYLHATVFGAIWIFVPLLTADCISRERRDGTLGLLFLTRLRASDIVLAKGLAHGLRAMTLWLAVVPVVTIPILLGGVGWNEALISVLVNFSAICLALAAGLLASAWSKAWLRALLGATFLAIGFLLALGSFTGCLLLTSILMGPGRLFAPSLDQAMVAGMGLVLNPTSAFRLIRRVSASPLIYVLSEVALACLLVLAAVVILAGQKTRRAWQDEPPSHFRLWWVRACCTPVVGVAFFHWWLRRKLLRNPIGWLEQRTWSGRLVTWGWLAVVISIYSVVLTDSNFFRGYSDLQRAMAWLMVGSVGLSATGSFRRERESGVMELLLVSPLRETDIIWGRLRGLWGQFLPAFVLLLGLWAYLLSLPYLRTRPPGADFEAILFFGSTYLCLPVIGLYFSLRCRNFMTGLLCTLVCGLLLPMVAPALIGWLAWLWSSNNGPTIDTIHLSAWAVVGQLMLAPVCWSRLRRRLQQRAFPMQRTER